MDGSVEKIPEPVEIEVWENPHQERRFFYEENVAN